MKSDERVFLPLTSQDFLWGSKERPRDSFLEAENDLARRSWGKTDVGLVGLEGGGGRKKLTLAGFDEEDEKRDLMAAAAETEEERREEEGVLEDDLSSTVRRSQRQDGQNPENCSSGWRSQLKEER